jgi:hypothetical protein
MFMFDSTCARRPAQQRSLVLSATGTGLKDDTRRRQSATTASNNPVCARIAEVLIRLMGCRTWVGDLKENLKLVSFAFQLNTQHTLGSVTLKRIGLGVRSCFMNSKKCGTCTRCCRPSPQTTGNAKWPKKLLPGLTPQTTPASYSCYSSAISRSETETPSPPFFGFFFFETCNCSTTRRMGAVKKSSKSKTDDSTRRTFSQVLTQ